MRAEQYRRRNGSYLLNAVIWFVGELNNTDVELVHISSMQHTWFVAKLNNKDV